MIAVRGSFGPILASLLVFLPLLVWGQAMPTPDDPDLLALLAARSAAEAAIGQGDHAGALNALRDSLRGCPPDRAGLADAAYANGQLFSFVLLHVMPEPPAWAYLESGFAPEAHETDKMLKVLCTIAIGLNDAQKTEYSREASYLSDSGNQIVRAITRFYLSNPYFYDLGFTNQFAEALGEEFPNLELTQVSLNLSLYNKRETGDFPELAAEIAAKSAKLSPCKPWSASLRARIGQCAAALAEKKAPTREAALAPLLDGLDNATDWRERHFALLLLKSEFEGPLGARMREAARALAARGENTPDVLQARALLATVRSADSAADPGDAEAPIEAVALAETLLAAGVDVTTPERVLWETWAYSILDCADNLARAGRKDEAIELYSGLIARLPGSKIADACATARGDLFHRKPLPLPGNAE